MWELQKLPERLGCAAVTLMCLRPARNGIVERCHRTIRTFTARKQCTIEEAVYWHNVTPKDSVLSSSALKDTQISCQSQAY